MTMPRRLKAIGTVVLWAFFVAATTLMACLAWLILTDN